jgi:hypothetical protein
VGKVISTRHGFKRTSFNFYEKQRFTSKLLLGALMFVELGLIYILIEQELSGRLWGMKPVNPFILFGILFFVTTPLITLFLITRFDTVINDDGIFYRWRPYNRSYSIYDWSAIRTVSIVEMKGVRIGKSGSLKGGERHHLGGKFGMQLETKSGKIKILGTHRPEELNRILVRVAGDRYRSNSEHSFDYA